MIAVIHEVQLTAGQRDKLVRLLRSHRTGRPSALVARLLWWEGDKAHLVTLWESRDALDRHLAAAEAPPVPEMLATVGAQAQPRIVDVAEYG